MAGINVTECLKVFRKVVDKGSFSAAARDLGLSPAWAAKSVSRLEAHLDVTLLIRTTRNLRLTDAGQKCYRSAETIIDELAVLHEELQERSTALSGTIRISVPNIIALHNFGKLASSFQLKHADVKLDIVVGDRFVDVVQDEFDLALRIASSLSDSALIARKLADIPRVLCASPAYLESHDKIERAEDLEKHRLIVHSVLHTQHVWEFTGDADTHRYSPRPAMQINNSFTIKSVILAGGGIGFVPRPIVEDEIASGQILEIKSLRDSQPLQLFVVRPPNKHLPKRVRIFIDYLISAYRNSDE